jgi:hypothetical protein
MRASLEPQTVWAITPSTNPRRGVRGTLAVERGGVTFTPEEAGAPGLAFSAGQVIAVAKAPSSPILELSLASPPDEVLLYFAEPSFFFLDFTDLYKMAFADVFLADVVNEWLQTFLRPPPEPSAPWTVEHQERLQQLEGLREQRGLSDEDASELGRLYADRDGEEYGGVEGRPHPDVDRTERPWRWADVNHPGEGLNWVGGTSETGTNLRARQVLGKRPPPHARNR